MRRICSGGDPFFQMFDVDEWHLPQRHMLQPLCSRHAYSYAGVAIQHGILSSRKSIEEENTAQILQCKTSMAWNFPTPTKCSFTSIIPEELSSTACRQPSYFFIYNLVMSYIFFWQFHYSYEFDLSMIAIPFIWYFFNLWDFHFKNYRNIHPLPG